MKVMLIIFVLTWVVAKGSENYICNDLPQDYDLSLTDNERERVMIKENNLLGYKYAYEGDGINISSRMEYQRGNVQKDSCQTLKTNIEIGVVVKDEG